MRTIRSLGLMLIGSFLAVLAEAQNAPPKDMKAREAFFFPKATLQQTGNKGGSRPAATAAPNRGAAAPAPASPQEKPVTPTATLVGTAPSDSPLALRYSLRKRLTNTRSEEVDTDTTFSQGDAIKVLVTVNEPAYLYVAELGSSGTWKVLFPDAGENNFVSGYADIAIPRDDGTWLRFDATPGEEHLFIAASRRPIADLEQVISGRRTPPAPRPDEAKRPPVQLVLNDVPDSMISRLRNTVLTRDLVVEKIDAAGGTPEHAVYVATVVGTGGLVIADFKLQHRR